MTLEEALRKQIELCITMENYRCGVYVASKDHFKKACNIWEKVMDKYTWNYILKYYNVPSGVLTVDFTNYNRLKIIILDEKTVRMYKHNGVIIDSEIDTETKNIFVYPSLVPRIGRGQFWESWDVVKSRVFEVDFPEENTEENKKWRDVKWVMNYRMI